MLCLSAGGSSALDFAFTAHTQVALNEAPAAGVGGFRSFTLKGVSRGGPSGKYVSLHLAAEAAEEAELWVHAVQQAVAKRRAQSV
jgi:hypothetical protein